MYKRRTRGERANCKLASTLCFPLFVCLARSLARSQVYKRGASAAAIEPRPRPRQGATSRSRERARDLADISILCTSNRDRHPSLNNYTILLACSSTCILLYLVRVSASFTIRQLSPEGRKLRACLYPMWA